MSIPTTIYTLTAEHDGETKDGGMYFSAADAGLAIMDRRAGTSEAEVEAIRVVVRSVERGLGTTSVQLGRTTYTIGTARVYGAADTTF